MIIVRGVNHYAEDLEETVYQLTGQPRSLAVAVFGFNDAEVERVAMVVEVNPRDRKNLRQFAQQIRQTIYEQHLLHAHSIVFVRRGKILKTSSGKVRRAATRDLYLSGELDVLSESIVEESLNYNDGVAPATLLADRPTLAPTARHAALLEQLAAIVSQITKHPVSSENSGQPLVRLGLDSLKAVQILHRIETESGVSITLASVLNSSLRDLATAIDARLLQQEAAHPGSAGPLAETPAPISRWPLSIGQQGLWFLQCLNPLDASLNSGGLSVFART